MILWAKKRNRVRKKTVSEKGVREGRKEEKRGLALKLSTGGEVQTGTLFGFHNLPNTLQEEKDASQSGEGGRTREVGQSNYVNTATILGC